MRHNKTIFSSTEMWTEYGQSADYVERQHLVERLIDNDSLSIFDIGCGKGEIINSLNHQYPNKLFVGSDLSKEALDYVEVATILSSLPSLPFRAGQFDTVICLQVLEHLPSNIYEQAIAELERVANNQIIIGIPFAENLQAKMVFCARCGKKSHADGHLRNYYMKDMLKLFNKFSLQSTHFAGVNTYRKTKFGTQIQQKIGGIYYQPRFFVCPYCDGHDFLEIKKSPLRRKMSVAMSLPFGTFSKIPYWLICEYKREVV